MNESNRQFKSIICNVSTSRGAPMGRREYCTANMRRVDVGALPNKMLYCRQVPISQGYDKGGAYWGCGETLYAIFGQAYVDGIEYEYAEYVRAKSRADAIEKSDANPCQFVR